ncbi:MAG: hypothetical protein H0U12_10495 [Thermoleophilaceae bacterium]|nr:hypothetical protein [Thermoleophilaceae bacterium]
MRKLEVAEAARLAAATHGRYRIVQGHYRNLPRSHLLGKLGEFGAEKWLRSAELSVDAAYRDPAREGGPDVLVRGHGLEVKSWRPDTWSEWGRCVTPAQLPSIQRKSEAILWCVVEEADEWARIELKGWSTPQDVAATEIRPTGPSYKPIMNHQVALDALRDLRDLLDRLQA